MIPSLYVILQASGHSLVPTPAADDRNMFITEGKMLQ